MRTLSKKFNRVFVTGDIHGQVFDLADRLEYIENPTKNDLLIILGDCGFFYSVYYDKLQNDIERQKFAAKLPITILCIQGNHEQPFEEMDAEKITLLSGEGYFSNGLFFAKNGTVLNLSGKRALIVGGAYSVDKKWRLASGSAWWQNEEMSEEELGEICKNVEGKSFDFVLTHTCPYNFLPREVFLEGINQSAVSHRTEHALQRIHDSIEFEKWCCGHFHVDKEDGKIEFFYQWVKQIV